MNAEHLHAAKLDGPFLVMTLPAPSSGPDSPSPQEGEDVKTFHECCEAVTGLPASQPGKSHVTGRSACAGSWGNPPPLLRTNTGETHAP